MPLEMSSLTVAITLDVQSHKNKGYAVKIGRLIMLIYIVHCHLKYYILYIGLIEKMNVSELFVVFETTNTCYDHVTGERDPSKCVWWQSSHRPGSNIR